MKSVDKEFLHIEKIFPFYAWLIPVNKDREKKKFFSDSQYNPQFQYTWDEKTVSDVEKILNSIQLPDSLIGELYKNLKHECMNKIELIKAIGSPARFTKISEKIYGTCGDEDIEFAQHILDTYPDNNFSESIDPEKIKKELEKEIKRNKIKGWKIILKKDIASKVTVKPQSGTIYVKKDFRFFPEEAERLRVHEIKVHLFRAINGSFQEYPIFKTGLAGYLEAEEGLAVYFENKKGVCSSQQMKVYAGRLMAAQLAQKSSFRQTYDKLINWFPHEISYRLCERVKRGLTDTSQPGALTKDIHYITGYRKIEKLLSARDCIKELFCGKTGLKDIDTVGMLISEGKLKEPIYLP